MFQVLFKPCRFCVFVLSFVLILCQVVGYVFLFCRNIVLVLWVSSVLACVSVAIFYFCFGFRVSFVGFVFLFWLLR